MNGSGDYVAVTICMLMVLSEPQRFRTRPRLTLCVSHWSLFSIGMQNLFLAQAGFPGLPSFEELVIGAFVELAEVHVV